MRSPTAHLLLNPHENAREAWQTCTAWLPFTSPFGEPQNPAVSPFTHDTIPFFTLLYDPMSNMVNQQLQTLPLRAGGEGTGKRLPCILPIALQGYRCPFTRLSYIYLLCSIHPRREVLRLESDLTGVPSLNLPNCLGPSGFSVLRDM